MRPCGGHRNERFALWPPNGVAQLGPPWARGPAGAPEMGILLSGRPMERPILAVRGARGPAGAPEMSILLSAALWNGPFWPIRGASGPVGAPEVSILLAAALWDGPARVRRERDGSSLVGKIKSPLGARVRLGQGPSGFAQLPLCGANWQEEERVLGRKSGQLPSGP